MKLSFVILLLVVSLFLTGCGTSGPTPPDPTTYTIGGTVTGLTGTGLVLQNSGGNNLTVSAKATSFAFPTALASGSAYKVTVLTQPSSPTQSCVVTGGSGMAMGNVTSVSIACTTTTYTIGGSVSGLVGTGLVLQDNGGNNLTVPAGATTFSFPTALDAGANYAVSVLTQPTVPTQNCVVTGGSGTATGNVATVSIACTTLTYTVSGTISGLVGTGLVLQNNGSSLPVAAGATGFGFTAGVGEGLPYAVTVSAQPSNPVQSCAVVANGSATSSVNVNNVQVACTTTTFTIGGTVVGLIGKGLVLQNNAGDSLTVPANATSFTFATPLDSGASYLVTASGQPTYLTQKCMVTDGSGTASANVTSVVVTCTNVNEWTFESGSTLEDQSGIYPATVGSGGTGDLPGARYWGVSWSDTSGNFWLFGGYGYDSVGSGADLNDLWEASYSGGQWTWTWVGGDNLVAQGGTYPATVGTPGTGYGPGARDSAVSWTDAKGNFWLFGGHGYDVNRMSDNLNDLWEYSPSTGHWTWVSGSNTVDQAGNYGPTMGVGSTTTVPGARYSAVSWTDTHGNFWLFGGLGLDSNGKVGSLNDLWEGSNSSGQWIWTWMGPVGSDVAGASGAYGNGGVSSTSNFPGARYLSTSWTDAQGNLWLFGGYGSDSQGNTADLSDLWEYTPSTTPGGAGGWAWYGSENAGTAGVYGPIGMPGPTYLPGSRKGAVGWSDSLGNFWLFGGLGLDTTGHYGQLNDLWLYNPTTGEWTWEGPTGSNVYDQPGVYGPVGTAGANYFPGGRGGAANWIDSSGNLWLFGGNGPLSGPNGSFSDLWMFEP
jgi:hypothetical protein